MGWNTIESALARVRRAKRGGKGVGRVQPSQTWSTAARSTVVVLYSIASSSSSRRHNDHVPVKLSAVKTAINVQGVEGGSDLSSLYECQVGFCRPFAQEVFHYVLVKEGATPGSRHLLPSSPPHHLTTSPHSPHSALAV